MIITIKRKYNKTEQKLTEHEKHHLDMLYRSVKGLPEFIGYALSNLFQGKTITTYKSILRTRIRECSRPDQIGRVTSLHINYLLSLPKTEYRLKFKLI